MSGASEALTKLRDACAAPVAAVASAVSGASRAQARFKAVDDILEGMADAANLILALEHLSGEAKVAEKAARLALATMMAENHAPSISTGTHTVSVSKGRSSVEIVDASAVPADLMNTPEPQPDKKKVAAFLKAKIAAKETVNWARFERGLPVLTIKNSEA